MKKKMGAQVLSKKHTVAESSISRYDANLKKYIQHNDSSKAQQIRQDLWLLPQAKLPI